MAKLNDFGFGLNGRGADAVGDDTFAISVDGRVSAAFNYWYTLNTTYGNGYYQINSFYGNNSGTDMLNFNTIQADLVVPKDCHVVGFSASWYLSSSTNFTEVEIGLAKATYSGATRTESTIGSESLSGMTDLNTRYSIVKNNLNVALSAGDGIIPCIKRVAPITMTTAYLNGFNMQIICEVTT